MIETDSSATLSHDLRRGLESWGSKRIWIKDKWYWLIKPDIRFGEVVNIE